MKLFKGLFLSTIIFCFSFNQMALPRISNKEPKYKSSMEANSGTSFKVTMQATDSGPQTYNGEEVPEGLPSMNDYLTDDEIESAFSDVLPDVIFTGDVF